MWGRREWEAKEEKEGREKEECGNGKGAPHLRGRRSQEKQKKGRKGNGGRETRDNSRGGREGRGGRKKLEEAEVG